MAKNTGLDFDFGSRFGVIENKLETVISAVEKINTNFTTRFDNLEIRTDGLEKYKNNNDIDIKWIKAIGVFCIAMIMALFTFGTGIAQNVISEVAKSSIVNKKEP